MTIILDSFALVHVFFSRANLAEVSVKKTSKAQEQVRAIVTEKRLTLRVNRIS